MQSTPLFDTIYRVGQTLLRRYGKGVVFLHTKAPHEQFYRYVIPAMASQLLTGFFIIVDGFFIGQSIGDVGLASINILWPIAAVILATGLGIGSGGSVVMTHAMGAGDTEKALAARGNTLLCLGAATVLLTAALGLSYPWLLRLLGATGELYQPAADYTVVVVLAGGLQIFNSGLNPLLRGSGRTVAAMAIMIFSLLCNILLDWLFIAVFAWGMRGAALATVTAQGLSALAALLCLLMNKNAPVHARQFCPDPRLCKKLLTVGVSPFGLSMSASVLIMLNNWQCIRYGGAGAVATYAILSYVLGALQPLLSGIGEGIQPLVSFCHGAGDLAAQHHLQRRALRLLLAVAAVLCAGTFLAREQLPLLFGASSETARESVPALLFAVASLPLWGLVRLYASCFYATGQTRRSLFFIFGDPLGASPLFLFLLPPMLGVNGIWAAAPAAQALLFLCLLGMFRQDGRRSVQRT